MNTNFDYVRILLVLQKLILLLGLFLLKITLHGEDQGKLIDLWRAWNGKRGCMEACSGVPSTMEVADESNNAFSGVCSLLIRNIILSQYQLTE